MAGDRQASERSRHRWRELLPDIVLRTCVSIPRRRCSVATPAPIAQGLDKHLAVVLQEGVPRRGAELISRQSSEWSQPKSTRTGLRSCQVGSWRSNGP